MVFHGVSNENVQCSNYFSFQLRKGHEVHQKRRRKKWSWRVGSSVFFFLGGWGEGGRGEWNI